MEVTWLRGHLEQRTELANFLWLGVHTCQLATFLRWNNQSLQVSLGGFYDFLLQCLLVDYIFGIISVR